MQVLASPLPFLANRNAEQAVPPLFWPVNCIKIGRHVALLSGPSVYVYSVVGFYLCFYYSYFTIAISLLKETVSYKFYISLLKETVKYS